MSDKELATLRRALGPDVTDDDAQQWLTVAPVQWVVRYAPALRSAGLTVPDAKDLVRRLGANLDDVGRILSAARMAGIDVRWIHLWAAADFVKGSHAPAEPERDMRGRRRRSAPARGHAAPWVTEARKYIAATDGNEKIAAAAAAAGFNLDDTAAIEDKDDESTFQMLHVFASLRDLNGAFE